MSNLLLAWLLRKLGFIWWQKPKTDPYSWAKQPWVIIDFATDHCGCRRTRFRKHVEHHRLRHGMYYQVVNEDYDASRFVFKLYGPRPLLPRHMEELTHLTSAACPHSPAASVQWSPKEMKKSHVIIKHKEV